MSFMMGDEWWRHNSQHTPSFERPKSTVRRTIDRETCCLLDLKHHNMCFMCFCHNWMHWMHLDLSQITQIYIIYSNNQWLSYLGSLGILSSLYYLALQDSSTFLHDICQLEGNLTVTTSIHNIHTALILASRQLAKTLHFRGISVPKGQKWPCHYVGSAISNSMSIWPFQMLPVPSGKLT